MSENFIQDVGLFNDISDDSVNQILGMKEPSPRADTGSYQIASEIRCLTSELTQKSNSLNGTMRRPSSKNEDLECVTKENTLERFEKLI